MKRPSYQRTKPSGVEWLGELPEHWQVKRLKMSVRLTDRKVEADEENPIPYIGMENIESWTGRLLSINPDVVPAGTANAFNAGSTLFGKLRPYLAKACNPDFDGLCSTELLVLQGVDLNRHALLYSLLSDGFIKLVDSSTYGSKMPRANWDFIGNCLFPIPSPAEQGAIAEFLDRETGRIDRLVGRKRELIERLKEKRIALISRTVTRGLPLAAARATDLPGNPTLKPSGLDWLREIPAHWDVKKVRYLFRFTSGGTPSTDTPDYWDGNLPWVSPKDMKVFRLSDTEDHVTDLAIKETATTLVPPETLLLVARSGILRHSLPVAVTTRKMTINQDIKGVIPLKKPVSVDYFAWLIEGHQSQLLTMWRKEGATVESLELDLIKNCPIPVPPHLEQVAIATYLDAESAKLDALMAKVDGAIERLQEYRTALITAAVTGKIDVREAVP